MKKSAIYILLSLFLTLTVIWIVKNGFVREPENPQYESSPMITDNIWDQHLPQSIEERIFREPLERVHRISLEEHGIFKASSLATDEKDYLAIYDYGYHQVFLFDINDNYSVRTLGDGPGRGPREFINPTDLAFDEEGNLWVADPKLARISGYTPGDKLIKNLNPDKVLPFRIVARKSDLIILAGSSASGGTIFQYDFEGRHMRTFERSSTKNQANSLLTSGDLAVSSGNVYYALSNVGIIRKYDADMNLVYSRGTIEPVEPARVESIDLPILGDAVGHRIAEDSKIASLDVAATEDYLYVLFSGTKYGAYFLLDVYNPLNGNYLFSYELDYPAGRIVVLKGILWVYDYIDRVPHLSGYRLPSLTDS